jgi:threonylcarbamoyladenosine tRNA methylthiotransferase CDKAL1
MKSLQVFVRSFGCSSNMADGEVLTGCLAEAGFQLALSESDADLLVYNTCAVKGPTENRIIDALKCVPYSKKVIVAGCLPMISFERLLREVRFDGIVGPAIGRGIVDVLMRVLAGEKVVDLSALDKMPMINLPKVKSNPFVSIIPINYGCLGSCAYCCVVFARGALRSYSINDIANQVKSDYAAGAREFWITSQDTACYGRDIGTSLADLLFALGGLEGDFRIRVGMMTPNMMNQILGELIEAFNSDKIFKFLHLPIQSGDDQILKWMQRHYNMEQFKGIVNMFRAEFSDLTLATDVIVGFPGETEEAFQNTLKVLEDVKPDVVNVSKFFARPKTAAAKIKEGLVEREEIKRRSTVTAQVAKQLSADGNLRWVGWTGDVLIDEHGKIAGSWVGRNFAYKPIVVKSLDNQLGKTLRVKVVEASGTYLKGKLLEE